MCTMCQGNKCVTYDLICSMLNRNIALEPSLKHDHVLKHMLSYQNQE